MARGRRAAAAEPSALASVDLNLEDEDEDIVLPSDDEDMDESYLADVPSTRKSSIGSSANKKHFLAAAALLKDSADEDADESYMAPLRNDDSDDDEDNGASSKITNTAKSATARRSMTGRKSIGGSGGKNSKKAGKGGKSKADKRRRRRSSARFLRLSGRFEADEDDTEQGGNGGGTLDKENLGEVYRQAIRMNAENKINAGNSWGLKLIENMDKLVHGVDDDATAGHGDTLPGGGGEKRVNFTKASCTLDASVKIYGYRVDDVHLTSYKVLHNLNRTDAGGGKKKAANDDAEGGIVDSDVDGDDGESGRSRKHKRGMGTTETLESNLANINMSKLDSAPDIDPLFRKMSKAFDEGGAKGLLLNNLGVARDGCRIEFDSKEDTVTESVISESSLDTSNGNKEDEVADDDNEEEAKAMESDEANNDDQHTEDVAADATVDDHEEGMVDVTGLVSKLKEVLNGSTLESLPFVPQLEMLRADFAALEADGFADDGRKKGPSSRPARYGVTDEEEKEAERSIHIEAIERSHRSTANVSFAGMSTGGMEDDGGDMFGADDFGGGADDFDDDDDEDMVFSNFLAMDTNAEKYSAVEFHSSEGAKGEEALPATAMRTRTTTTALLDAICSSDALIAGGEFDYFNADTLDKITKGNMWAGSEHWKKTDKVRSKKQKEATGKKKPTSRKKKKNTTSKERAFVDLTSPSHSCLDELIKNKPKPKGKSKSDPLQLTKAAITKQEKNDNLLPPDAGVGIEQLSRLFMRPDAAVQPKKAAPDTQKTRKSVGFFDMGPTVFDDGDDGSFGGDDDGPGFILADDDDSRDDFVIGELEGVRKVQKVNIGYATAAKKVDVKRLKKDLWNSLETRTAAKPEKEEYKEGEEGMDTEKAVEGEGKHQEEAAAAEKSQQGEDIVSFQETVKELSASQSQSEITLPFYFICILHLANEKGLFLDPSGQGLTDFIITRDDGMAPTVGTMPESVEPTKPRRKRGGAKQKSYQEVEEDAESDVEAMSEDED